MREYLIECFNAAVEDALEQDARIIILDTRSLVEIVAARPELLDDLPNDLDFDPTALGSDYGFTYRGVSIFYGD